MGKIFFVTIFSLVCLISLCFAASDFDRNFEPVIVKGADLNQFAGVAFDDLFLFAYDDNGHTWQQIPAQFDDVDDAGNYVFPGGTDGSVDHLDANDEMVFMAKDAGDKNTTSWINDLNSQNYVRIEIKVSDPITENSVYVYLYRSSTLATALDLTDYVKYFASSTQNVTEDRVESLFYKSENAVNGLPDNLVIPQSAGGNGQNLFDRMKFRAQINFFGTINIDEDDLIFDANEGDEILVKDGLVRIIRVLNTTLLIDLGIVKIPADFTLPGFYYPYSSSIDVKVPGIQSATVNTGRISMDFSANASGMKFASAKNQTPVNVDGAIDANINTTLDGTVLPKGNWLFYGEGTQSQGTVVTLFPVELTVGNARQLYYKDNSATDANDTGDKKSYSDAGLALSGGITTPFTLNYEGFYLGTSFASTGAFSDKRLSKVTQTDITSDFGAQVAEYKRNPLETTPTPQDLGSVPVELVAFTAAVNQNNVRLIWRTATESNNFGFAIEVKSGSNNSWQKIGFIDGHGTSSEAQKYEFVDANLQPGEYAYRLKQIDTNGNFEYSSTVSATVGLPATFALEQNYPNPFNPTTNIGYRISGSSGSDVKQTVLKIYNLIGHEISTLVNQEQSPGYYTVTWNGRDKTGRIVPSGIYIYRIQSGDFVDTKKMLLVK